METPLYQMEKLKHRYNGHPVLDIPDMTIRKNTIIGLMGPNGSGKSTFLKILGFITRPAEGQVLYNGRPEKPFSDAVRAQVTLLPQNPLLLKRTVYNNVAYGLRLKGRTGRLGHQIAETLEMVGLEPETFAGRQWHELSGGEAQRVALAARLALRPAVLLLDEPTTGVDAASIQRIKEASLQAREEWGATLVIASHDFLWMQEICDHIFHLFNGRVSGSGYDTIVFGPWSETGGGLWEKELTGGQRMPVSRPPHEKAACVIPARAVSVAGGISTREAPAACLKGRVSRLTLEKSSGQIIVAIRVGQVSFTALLSEDDIRSQSLHPGREAAVIYDPLAVLWFQ